jgi:hypothetical protein
MTHANLVELTETELDVVGGGGPPPPPPPPGGPGGGTSGGTTTTTDITVTLRNIGNYNGNDNYVNVGSGDGITVTL